MLGWACHETGGGMSTALVLRGNTISGSKYGWAFMSALNVSRHKCIASPMSTDNFLVYARELRHDGCEHQRLRSILPQNEIGLRADLDHTFVILHDGIRWRDYRWSSH